MALRTRLPQDVLANIFQYDGTYRDELQSITDSIEFKRQVWRNWKKQLFSCNRLRSDILLRRRLEFILDYQFDRTMAMNQPFPANISIRCPSKMFYYSNQKECPHCPSHYNEMFRRGVLDKTIEISFEHNNGKIEKYIGEVFTKEEYQTGYLYNDDAEEFYCFYSNRDFYLIEHVDITKNEYVNYYEVYNLHLVEHDYY